MKKCQNQNGLVKRWRELLDEIRAKEIRCEDLKNRVQEASDDSADRLTIFSLKQELCRTNEERVRLEDELAKMPKPKANKKKEVWPPCRGRSEKKVD